MKSEMRYFVAESAVHSGAATLCGKKGLLVAQAYLLTFVGISSLRRPKVFV